MDEDENLSMLLAMGFPDIGEAKRALRIAKNDINEAVAILTNEQPISNEIDMHDISASGKNDTENTSGDGGFPTTNLYELEQRVFQDNWSIPYKNDESLGKCLIACTKLLREGLPIENDGDCRKFLDSVMPEAFKKLLTSNATSKWHSEIQEGIYNMLELFLDLILVRSPNPPIPISMFNTLALAFDVENDWNYKNRNQISQGRWQSSSSRSGGSNLSSADDSFTKVRSGSCDYGWLCDLINRFGEGGGFDLIHQCLQRDGITGKEIASLLGVCANCATVLNDVTLEPLLTSCINAAFDHLKRLGEDELKTKEATSFSELIGSLKLLCHHFRKESEEHCDTVRLDLICRMLKTPMFNTRMNGLKEVSRLIDESDRGHYQSGRKGIISISSNRLAIWMAKNRVLSVALEGNLDQTQYAERLKAIVEFLGPRLGQEDIDRMWQLLDTSTNSQIIENVHSILATAASKLNLELYEHLTSLIKKKWEVSEGRVREKLLRLIGQIGREAKQAKSIEATLQVLWEVSHLESLPRSLLERAHSEQLAIITEMNLNKDSHRRTYINACVEDIKKGKREHVLPAIIHLYKLCKSGTRGSSSFYQKSDKAFLSELHTKHGIIKLLTNSLGRCHHWGLEAAISTAASLKPDSSVDGRFTYKEYVEEHLQLLKLFLQDGNLYLSWEHTKELWETLVDNSRAIPFETESCYSWFKECISDLESDTQLKLFKEKLLSTSPDSMSERAFECFKDYFESVNISEGKIRKGFATSLQVESQDLIGYDFLWNLLTECRDEKIANDATEYLLKLCFTCISPKLRKDMNAMHRRFIDQCSHQLKAAVETSSLTVAVQQGYELETSSTSSDVPTGLCRTQVTTSSSIPLSARNASTEASSEWRHQTIRRLLHLAERYIQTVEEAFNGKRMIPPHAATFFGKPTVIKVIYEAKKDEFEVNSHSHERIGMAKRLISEKVQQPVGDLTFECRDTTIGSNKDNCFLSTLDTGQWTVKLKHPSSSSSSSTALVIYDADNAGACSSSTSGASGSGVIDATISVSDQVQEQEKGLPGVMISTDENIFILLYKLATLKDSTIQASLRKLLHLIPSDPMVLGELDIGDNDQLLASSSPKVSPRKAVNNIQRPDAAKDILYRLLDPAALHMSPLRVLYNLEILSSRLLPSNGSVECRDSDMEGNRDNCLRAILRLFGKEFLPADTENEVRKSIYVISLQLTRFLLCGQGVVQRTGTSAVTTSPLAKPTPPKKSALDHSTVTFSACRVMQKMSEPDFLEMVTCLMGVSWAAGAGDLQLLASSGSQNTENRRHPMRMLATRRSRDSSTGSSTGSEMSLSLSSSTAVSSSGTNRKKLLTVDDEDSLIASEAFDLLTTCLQLRTQSINGFFQLPNLEGFLVETLLGSPSSSVRGVALEQLKKIASIRPPNAKIEPRQLLTKLILKAPVPLWMPSCKARSLSHQLLGQCSEYFQLRCHLLENLTLAEQESLGENARTMLEDELTFLHSYGPCSLQEDCTLLAGHLRLVQALLTAEGVSTDEVGKNVISDLLDSHLFPASKVIVEGSQQVREINPKLDTADSRTAAYDLLTKLARGHEANLTLIVTHLVNMHHTYDETLAKEFEFEPLVERRAACNFVGLKNAGATCYMNSVLQQLYNVPGLCDAILGNDEEAEEETILYQLQSVFGHLLSSKLKYHVPEKFWQTFRLFGQPVNVREQQDAFEFYTQIIDQVDEFLMARKKTKAFPTFFEGIFSDQKICQECPHRFEREQTFMALNLTVKSSNLLESLEQFVRGELLDGDNAYFCEKCQEKRSAIKRMCIRQLPKTLVIQLKRFHYDYETNRAVKFDDHFEFPRLLDMGPYTTEGLKSSASDTTSASTAGESKYRRSMSMSRKSKVLQRDVKQPYDLVGVVVHSGQANAGHYYSFIKNRYSSGEKWFKFNDTTVEEVDMNEDTLKQECFGGSYKVKKVPGSSLPEDRQRYWNAYMLFYESRGSRKRPVRSLTMSATSSSPVGASRKISMPTAPPRESLSQLSDLLEKGEKTGLFSSRNSSQMPSTIEQGIQEENLRFLLRRDVYCEEYFRFVTDLTATNSSKSLINQNPKLAIQSVKLAVHFLLNSYAHFQKRNKSLMSSLVDTIETYVEYSSEASQWLISFLASSDGLRYLRPFLLECGAKEVRLIYSRLLSVAFRFYHRHFLNLQVDHVDKILDTLFNLIKTDASNHIKNCGQLFAAVTRFANLGLEQCQQLFKFDFFTVTMKLLLGVGMEESLESLSSNRPRKWASKQNRELGDLHSTLATLILACDTTEHQMKTDGESGDEPFRATKNRVFDGKLIPMPEKLSSILYSSVCVHYIREAVSACREVTSVVVPVIIDGLIHAAYNSTSFSDLLLAELLKQYHSVSSGELKNLSSLLIDVLTLTDQLQSRRIDQAIYGNKDSDIEGLLQLIDQQHTTDSCRAYQCIKTLVTAAQQSPLVKDKLLEDPGKWQWAVSWLKEKMDGDNNTLVSGNTANQDQSGYDAASNEDSLTRTFHRTTSAVVTLAEANAILAEFDTPMEEAGNQMEIDTNKQRLDEDEEMSPDLLENMKD